MCIHFPRESKRMEINDLEHFTDLKDANKATGFLRIHSSNICIYYFAAYRWVGEQNDILKFFFSSGIYSIGTVPNSARGILASHSPSKTLKIGFWVEKIISECAPHTKQTFLNKKNVICSIFIPIDSFTKHESLDIACSNNLISSCITSFSQ